MIMIMDNFMLRRAVQISDDDDNTLNSSAFIGCTCTKVEQMFEFCVCHHGFALLIIQRIC